MQTIETTSQFQAKVQTVQTMTTKQTTIQFRNSLLFLLSAHIWYETEQRRYFEAGVSVVSREDPAISVGYL